MIVLKEKLAISKRGRAWGRCSRKKELCAQGSGVGAWAVSPHGGFMQVCGERKPERKAQARHCQAVHTFACGLGPAASTVEPFCSNQK